MGEKGGIYYLNSRISDQGGWLQWKERGTTLRISILGQLNLY
jgi:hypothetical protein